MPPGFETITLNSAHSMMAQFVPDGANLEAVQFGSSLEIGSFGLFDTASPNYNTFYPGVTAADFNPKDEDFITPTFRLLSETTVHSNWNPISFKKPGVLKASMNKLLGQSINIDHETALGNAIGSVAKVFWQESYTTTHNGKKITIPAGINGVLKIDALSNPRIARGILMVPPSIHSNSVTVAFKWEQSHPELDRDEFMDKLGEKDDEGRLYEKVVNEIGFYSETSLVGHGADPYAQLLDPKDSIVNPRFAESVSNSFKTALNKGVKPRTCYDYKTCVLQEALETISNDATPPIIKTNDINIKNAFMKKQILALAALFSITVDPEIAEDQLASVLDNVVTSAGESVKLKEQVDTLTNSEATLKTDLSAKTKEVEDLTAELEAAKAMKVVGETALAASRAEAIRLYKVLNGDAAKAEIISNHETLSYEAAQSFIEQYSADLEAKLAGSGSGGGQEEEEEDDAVASFDALVEQVKLSKKGLPYKKETV